MTDARHPRVPASADTFTMSFEGRPVPVRHGQTIGAALLAVGQRALRTTRREGRPRGMFCGIGACFDCLVVVNGVPNQRACLTVARPGDEVRAQQGVS